MTKAKRKRPSKRAFRNAPPVGQCAPAPNRAVLNSIVEMKRRLIDKAEVVSKKYRFGEDMLRSDIEALQRRLESSKINESHLREQLLMKPSRLVTDESEWPRDGRIVIAVFPDFSTTPIWFDAHRGKWIDEKKRLNHVTPPDVDIHPVAMVA